MIQSAIKRLLGERGTAAIRSGRNTLRHYRQYAFGDGFAKPPTRLDLEITYRCNARCRMCPLYGEHPDGNRSRSAEPDPQNELTTSEIRSLLDQCAQLGISDVTITGGEPFVRKDLCEVLAYAKTVGLSTGLISNASMIGPAQAAGIVEAGLNSLNISLDGPAEVHDDIRRSPGMFARVERAISLVKEEKAKRGLDTPHIALGCTVSALNEMYIREVVETASQLGVEVSFNPIFYSTTEQEAATHSLLYGRPVKPEDWRLPERIIAVDVVRLAKQLPQAQALARTLGVAMHSRMGGQKDLVHRFEEPNYSENNKCLYPWYATRVTPSGTVYPCSISVDMGNIREQSLEAIWNGPKYVQFRRTLRRHRLFPKCAKCCVLDKNDLLCKLLP